MNAATRSITRTQTRSQSPRWSSQVVRPGGRTSQWPASGNTEAQRDARQLRHRHHATRPGQLAGQLEPVAVVLDLGAVAVRQQRQRVAPAALQNRLRVHRSVQAREEHPHGAGCSVGRAEVPYAVEDRSLDAGCQPIGQDAGGSPGTEAEARRGCWPSRGRHSTAGTRRGRRRRGSVPAVRRRHAPRTTGPTALRTHARPDQKS
jgi:hypothetical protein